MPRLISCTMTARPGGVALSVTRWRLPDSPYPEVLHRGIWATGDRWASNAEILRGMSEMLAQLADRLDAERE